MELITCVDVPQRVSPFAAHGTTHKHYSNWMNQYGDLRLSDLKHSVHQTTEQLDFKTLNVRSCPVGTMCNEIALRVHCRPGDEMIAHRTAHPIHFEAGGLAALAGVNVCALDGARGQYDEEAVAAIRPDSRYVPNSRLLWVDQTSNLGGGSIWPLARIAAVTDVARRRGMCTHLDGAPHERRGGERRRRLRVRKAF